MHEQFVHTPIASMFVAAPQKGVTDPLLTIFLQDGHADLGMMVVARQVCRSEPLLHPDSCR